MTEKKFEKEKYNEKKQIFTFFMKLIEETFWQNVGSALKKGIFNKIESFFSAIEKDVEQGK